VSIRSSRSSRRSADGSQKIAMCKPVLSRVRA
jgi:hypothetical protein